MAKLSAHGTEVARLDITRTVPDREYRIVYSFRSDGHVLRKLGDDGWKLWKRLSDPERDTISRMLDQATLYKAGSDQREDTSINSFTTHGPDE